MIMKLVFRMVLPPRFEFKLVSKRITLWELKWLWLDEATYPLPTKTPGTIKSRSSLSSMWITNPKVGMKVDKRSVF
jgi:hypothetical protein